MIKKLILDGRKSTIPFPKQPGSDRNRNEVRG